MTPDTVIELGRQGMNITVLLAAPLLLSALAAGLLIGMFQAATQINEMTLVFVPKIAAVFLVILALGGWMLEEAITFASLSFESIAEQNQ